MSMNHFVTNYFDKLVQIPGCVSLRSEHKKCERT